MPKNSIGNMVALEMKSVLESDEHKKLFCKEASVNENKEALVSDELETVATIEVESFGVKESFDNLVKRFVALSEDLDNLGFEKASSSLLNSFDVLLKEANGEKIEEMIEQTLQGFQDPNSDFEINVDVDMKDPVLEADPRLLGGELEEPQMMDLDEALKAIEELGLDHPEGPLSQETKKEMKDVGLGGLAKEIAEASKNVDAWLSKNADLDEQPFSDLELDADLSALLGSESLDDQLFAKDEDEDEGCCCSKGNLCPCKDDCSCKKDKCSFDKDEDSSKADDEDEEDDLKADDEKDDTDAKFEEED